MPSPISRTKLLPLILIAFLSGTVSIASQETQAKQKTRVTPALSNKVSKKLSEAQKATEEERYKEALEILDELSAKTGKRALNSYEMANVHNLYAFIYFSQDKTDKAIASYQSLLDQEAIPLAMELNTRYSLAQLLLLEENWSAGLKELNLWFSLNTLPGAPAFALRSQVYYQLNDYDNALKDIEKAMSMEKAASNVPKEQWYVLARYLHYKKNQLPEVITLLNELLVHYPRGQYWVQLSHMYGEMDQEKKQLAALESAYVQNYLTKESDLLNLAYLYLGADTPYKAASVLDQGLKKQQIKASEKTYTLLGNSWRKAQELDKAIPALKKAAELSDKGEAWVQLGNIHLDKEEYKQAVQALEAGLKKGQLKQAGNAQLSLGMAYFYSKEYDKARKAMKVAAKAKESKSFALKWLNYMDKEVKRQEGLRSS